MLLRTGVAALALMVASGAHAQTIYPIDRADILSGARFDLKVEFPGKPAADAVKVSVNGQDPAAVLGQAATFVAGEDGQDRSAFWIRGAAIAKPGHYTVEAKGADGKTATVAWNVYATPAKAAAKNVILFIGDGLSVAHRTAARILSKGIEQGKYKGELAIDDMPHMALVSTSGTDSVVTDSANGMSAYTTGHKSCVNALGVYCAANKKTLDHPKVETIAEIVKRARGKAVGVVTNTEIEDATPAGMVAHTRRRADFDEIVGMFYDLQPEVIMGGGSPHFLPKSTPGSKRKDETDYIARFKDAGYSVVTTASEMKAADGKTTRLLGLFNTGNIDGALDRLYLKKGTVSKFPDQPDLVDQVKVALDVLSRNDKGFVLMVESGRIDKYAHSLDWERSVFDTIMLDRAVAAAKSFAGDRNDTLIIVVGDHTHPVSIVGTYDDANGATPREKLGVYAEAGYPNYPPVDANGYPPSVDVSRRLAFLFGTSPDRYETAKPFLDGEFVPAVKGKDGRYVANEKYKDMPGAVFREGNLPADASSGVHSADDVVLTATGPGSEMFHGHIENTQVFKVMATSLGLGAVAD